MNNNLVPAVNGSLPARVVGDDKQGRDWAELQKWAYLRRIAERRVYKPQQPNN